MFRLKRTNLGPKDFFFVYEKYWLPSLTFVSLVINIPHSGAILDPLHKALLAKLKIMRNFPLIMRSTLTELGGLNIHSLEISSSAQAIQHLVSLFTSDIPSNMLISTAIQYYQLEDGVEKLFLPSSYHKLHKLETSKLMTHLREFLYLYRLEGCLSTLNLLSSSCFNDATIVN